MDLFLRYQKAEFNAPSVGAQFNLARGARIYFGLYAKAAFILQHKLYKMGYEQAVFRNGSTEFGKSKRFRHTDAVFDIVDTLKSEYPNVHFEACASGGGRTDLGALSHFDSVWPSDNTDPLDRLEIQKGYSLIYPRKCMRAWVTDTNKRKRPEPMKYRFAVSMQGSLSIGANLSLLKRSELLECKKQIALYKKIRHTVQFGSLYRIMDFEKDKIYFNGYVNADKSQAVYFARAQIRFSAINM